MCGDRSNMMRLAHCLHNHFEHIDFFMMLRHIFIVSLIKVDKICGWKIEKKKKEKNEVNFIEGVVKINF